METWNKRAPEIANLLNPAFCSSVMYQVIKEYQKKAKREFPFVLIYLIFPIILHKPTRERITSITNMVVWIQKYPDVLVGFPNRARSLVPFANESIIFMLQHNILKYKNGGLVISTKLSERKIDAIADQDIHECYTQAKNVGRWFAKMGAEENIYAAWGVKP